MAKGPAVVVVARHGARLDAADKQWHLTSPTPYDPPLTYGGWSQGKALGLRIASLLHARGLERAKDANNGPGADTTHDSSGPSQSTNKTAPATKKRKHKIIIHSSPFLRCVQTSTAIAAGISQFKPPPDEVPATATTLKVSYSKGSPLGKDPSPSAAVQPVRGRQAEKPEPGSPPKPLKSGWLRLTNPAVNSKPYIGPEKILLRIDAFLGEWLSPDYYEDITPPPNSTMMVAGAKADLLRRSDYIEAPPHKPTSVGHFPGGWVRSNAASAANSRKITGEGTFPSMGSLAQALPRERSNSQGAMLSGQRSRSQDPHGPVELAVTHQPNSRLYDAPVPSHAVSPAEPIPRGYATHARDACLKVDFQWDSMRVPQQWGDGGEFGDEWSTMHKRFRRGLAGMMQWYREHGTKTLPPQNMFPGFTFSERTTSASKKVEPTPLMPKPKEKEKDEDEDDEEELVLVLVTHGAGCNALLGAITNQPVLMDISLAALSMAVRREVPRPTSSNTVYTRIPSIVDSGMADTYEMKILASIDHLRPGVDPSKLPQSQKPTAAANATIGLEYRPPRRVATGTSVTSTPTSQVDSLALGPPARSGWNSSIGSIQRTSTSGAGSFLTSSTPSGSASPSTGGGSGLWGGSLRSISLNDTQADGRASPGAEMVEAFQNSQPKQTLKPPPPTSIPNVDGAASPKTAAVNGNEDAEKHDDVAPLSIPKRAPSAASKLSGGAAGGLWGAPKKQESGNGLWKNSSVMWGPPKLDEVYEHVAGPKRRWTMTERD
ncbi:hypothetical protein P171DRAFT_517352 [Karstenula rhodostoma CBS 690.94]|uniref:Phosphoglycerate mutase-like protein n=1 Tax=Karstenula rhodostoma CBS 690.94 TaxID=1392251 RepID=A0A9P4PT25_9PLEO|nr:hypothetical protein P171DRAFT_517352 [Karstenula rhodostoma CBS 690.94]